MNTNLIINLAIFSLFMIGLEPALTGNAFHEWLNLALGMFMLVHLVIHWEWIVAVLSRQTKAMARTVRVNFILNLILYVAFVIMIFSGLMISRTVISLFGFVAPRRSVWNELHSVFGNILILLIAVHIGLHWNWIVHACKRHIFTPLKSQLSGRV